MTTLLSLKIATKLETLFSKHNIILRYHTIDQKYSRVRAKLRSTT